MIKARPVNLQSSPRGIAASSIYTASRRYRRKPILGEDDVHQRTVVTPRLIPRRSYFGCHNHSAMHLGAAVQTSLASLGLNITRWRRVYRHRNPVAGAGVLRRLLQPRGARGDHATISRVPDEGSRYQILQLQISRRRTRTSSVSC